MHSCDIVHVSAHSSVTILGGDVRHIRNVEGGGEPRQACAPTATFSRDCRRRSNSRTRSGASVGRRTQAGPLLRTGTIVSLMSSPANARAVSIS